MNVIVRGPCDCVCLGIVKSFILSRSFEKYRLLVGNSQVKVSRNYCDGECRTGSV